MHRCQVRSQDFVEARDGGFRNVGSLIHQGAGSIGPPRTLLRPEGCRSEKRESYRSISQEIGGLGKLIFHLGHREALSYRPHSPPCGETSNELSTTLFTYLPYTCYMV